MPSNRHGMHRKYALSLPGEKKKNRKSTRVPCLSEARDRSRFHGRVRLSSRREIQVEFQLSMRCAVKIG